MDVELMRARAAAFVDEEMGVGESTTSFNNRADWEYFLFGYRRMAGMERSGAYADLSTIDVVIEPSEQIPNRVQRLMEAGAMLAMRQVEIESQDLSGIECNVEVER